eukprot:1878132-Prorocentrum_lima.AAC.1
MCIRDSPPSSPTCCWAGWCPSGAPPELWGLPLQVWLVLASYPLPRTALYPPRQLRTRVAGV